MIGRKLFVGVSTVCFWVGVLSAAAVAGPTYEFDCGLNCDVAGVLELTHLTEVAAASDVVRFEVNFRGVRITLANSVNGTVGFVFTPDFQQLIAITDAGGSRTNIAFFTPDRQCCIYVGVQRIFSTALSGGANGAWVPTLSLQSLALLPDKIVGGAGDAIATVTLTGAAASGGTDVGLRADTVWPILDVPSPQIASVTTPAKVPAGQTSADFPVHTTTVNYPLGVKVTASFGGTTKTAGLIVMPPPIPAFGPQADARVQAILNQFVVGPISLASAQAAWSNIQLLRKVTVNGQNVAGQDIYLAAAEHYLWALPWVLEHPTALVFVAGIIPMYEVVKLFIDASATDDPTSPSTVLSVQWGERGVIDAARILFGSSVPVRGTPKDLNRDGTGDIIWQNTSLIPLPLDSEGGNPSFGNVGVWFMNADGTVQGSVGLGNLAGWTPTVGDFNGDLVADILWQNTASGDAAVWFMNSDGTVQATAGLGNLAGWKAAAGDFNGDGIADILWLNASSGNAALWFMNADGTVRGSAGLGNLAGWTPSVGDFNGDGIADLLWHHTVTGNAALWFMSAYGTVQGIMGLGKLSSWTPTIGDFNGDGVADILWLHSSGSASVWLMNANGTVQSSAGLGNLAGWTAMTGDLNGDGKSDILWQNTASGNVAVWLMNGANVIQSIGLGNVSGWTPR